MNLNRSTVTKFIADTLHPYAYLEIGVYRGGTFNIINAPLKVGVDPDPESPATLHVTSDAFFNKNVTDFDLILVDGLHTYEQCYKDIDNAIMYLKPHGWIVVDDINPTFPLQAHPEPQPMNTIGWQGECYKAWIKMRGVAHGLGMVNVEGTNIGIMSRMLPSFRSRLIVTDVDTMTYETFAESKDLFLNPVKWNIITSYVVLARMYAYEKNASHNLAR